MRDAFSVLPSAPNALIALVSSPLQPSSACLGGEVEPHRTHLEAINIPTKGDLGRDVGLQVSCIHGNSQETGGFGREAQLYWTEHECWIPEVMHGVV